MTDNTEEFAARVSGLNPEETRVLLLKEGIDESFALTLKDEYFNGRMLLDFSKDEYKELGMPLAVAVHLVKIGRKFKSTANNTPEALSTRESRCCRDAEDGAYSMDSEEVCTLLKTHKLDQKVANKLKSKGICGRILLTWSDRQFRDHLKGVIIDQHLENFLDIRVAAIRRSPHDKRGAAEERMRPFFTPIETGANYRRLNRVRHENCSNSILEPTREFKELNPLENEKKFVIEVGKFIIACLNRRCNGTIYFGVVDGHKDGETYEHGLIHGVNIPSTKRENIQNLFDGNFIVMKSAKQFAGHNDDERDEMIRLVKSCVGLIQFVPVEGSNDDLVVVELDVKPSSLIVTKDRVFSLREKNQQKVTYLRDGASSVKIKEADLSSILKDIDMYTKARMEEEREANRASPTISERLKQLICLGYTRLDDKRFHYCLVTNLNMVEPNCEEAFSWISKVDWSVIFDFNPMTKEDGGLFKELQSKLELLQYANPSNLLESRFQVILEKEIKTLFVNCNENEENDDTDPRYFKKSKKAIIDAYEKIVRYRIAAERVVVLVLLTSRDHIWKIVDTLGRFKLGSPEMQQIVCLCQEENVAKALSKEAERYFAHEWRIQVVVVPTWLQLKGFFEQVTSTPSSGQTIPSSSDTVVTVSATCLQTLKKASVELLATNCCEDLSTEKYETKVERFLQGELPDWSLFSNNAKYLVERNMVSDIVMDLRKSTQKAGSIVVTRRLTHYPGAGATTVGRHVLWQLRNEMRCTVVNGDDFIDGMSYHFRKVLDMAKALHSLRQEGEEERDWTDSNPVRSCKPVLVLLDNAHPAMTKELKKQLGCCEKKKMTSVVRPWFIVLYLESSFAEPKPQQQQQENRYFLRQKLDEDEKLVFRAKLDDLRADQRLSKRLTVMLTFVIMATKGDSAESTYVINLVKSALKDLNEEWKALLLKVAIIKRFSNGSMPTSFFRINVWAKKTPTAEVDSCLRHPDKFLNSLPRQVEVFVRETKSLNVNLVGITHYPVACLLYRVLMKDKKSLSEVMTNMLENSASFCKDNAVGANLQETLRLLLLQREQRGCKRDNFSKLVEEVKKEENPKVVLEAGYRCLRGDKNKALVAQTLARLCYSEHSFVEARSWAQKAIDAMPKDMAMRDTMGRVFLKELKHLTRSSNNETYLLEALHLTNNADEHFRCANELHDVEVEFNNSKEFSEHALMGLVQVHLTFMTYVMKTLSNERETILKAVRQNDVSVVARYFKHEEITSYFENRFETISLVDAARQLLYVSPRGHFPHIFEKNHRKFRNVFNCTGDDDNAAKITNTFVWLKKGVKNGSISAKDVCQSRTDDQFKLHFLNIAFALAVLKRKPLLSWESTKVYCQELVKAGSEAPEPYLFYLVLYWPNASMSQPCQERLMSFQRKYDYSGIKVPPVFFWKGAGDEWQSIVSVDAPSKHRTRANGVLKKNIVEVKPGGDGNILQLTSRDMSKCRMAASVNVSFEIGFTFAGPVACSIEDNS